MRAELRPHEFVAKTKAGIKSTTDRYATGFSYEIGEENLTRTATEWGTVTVSIVQHNTQVRLPMVMSPCTNRV